tara:strand:- start:46 stop:429 length:384 start_codon:yes stop_codon:yes gene_type:complete
MEVNKYYDIFRSVGLPPEITNKILYEFKGLETKTASLFKEELKNWGSVDMILRHKKERLNCGSVECNECKNRFLERHAVEMVDLEYLCEDCFDDEGFNCEICEYNYYVPFHTYSGNMNTCLDCAEDP